MLTSKVINSIKLISMELKRIRLIFYFLILSGLALSGMLLYTVEGTARYYDFVVSDKNFTRLCHTKSAMVVNESLPGPVIYVNKGDTIYVNVHNQANFKVTIHWHGVKQPRNSWSDGTEYITQCAIQSGSNFTYEVIFSDEEGTLWWHAHNEWTRNTVHGAIVIHPKQGSFYPFPKPDGEEVLVFGSWYNFDINPVIAYDLAHRIRFPDSNAFTINGQPGDFCACSKESTYRWQVDYGKTYLLRLVNAAENVEFFFAIAEHNITVVGMDGSYLKPFVTSYVLIATGQTVDVLVTANQSIGQYYIAAREYTVENSSLPYDESIASAILEYRGNYSFHASPSFPSETLPSARDETAADNFRNKLKSLHAQNVPKNITTRMYITTSVSTIYKDDLAYRAASLNNVTWVNPKTDVLQAYYWNISGFYTEDFPDMPPYFFNFTGQNLPEDLSDSALGTKVKVLEYGEEVEIVFQNTNLLSFAEDHPMHLHGYCFYVVGRGYGNFDFEEDPKTYNLIDPPCLNTATDPKDGWVALRFKATNPGVWLWHCHFDQHLTYGMNYVIIVKDGGTPETSLRKPPRSLPSCYDAPYILLWKSEY